MYKDAFQAVGAVRSASLSSIIIGGFVAAAIVVTFTAMALALGFGEVSMFSENPLAGVGGALGIPSVIGIALALVVGAFIAGNLAGQSGYAHGLGTWAVLLLLSLALGSMAVSGAARTVGSVTGAAVSAAGSAAGGVAQGAGGAVSKGVELLNEEILGEINWEETTTRLNETLRNTNVPGLQPEQLRREFRDAGREVATAGRSILINPANSDAILESLGNKLDRRLDASAQELDRNAAVTSLTNNGFQPDEAEQAIQNAEQIIADTRETMRAGVENASSAVSELRQSAQQLKEQAKVAADEAAETSARASWWGFIGSTLGAILAALAGHFGAIVARKEEAV